MMQISAVIPLYNEEEVMHEFSTRLLDGLNDITSGCRIYTTKTVESVREELVAKNFEVTAELLIRAKKKGFSITEVPISFRRRPRGTSKLSFLKSGVGYVILLFRLGF